MAKMRVQPGQEWDIVSPKEMTDALEQHKRGILDHLVREGIRGIKQLKAKGKVTDNAAANVSGVVNGPQPGYAWMLRRFTTFEPSTTPGSIANTFLSYSADGTARNDNVIISGAGPGFWSFSQGVIVINAGDDLVWTFLGTNTGKTFYMNAEITEVPAEMLAKLLT